MTQKEKYNILKRKYDTIKNKCIEMNIWNEVWKYDKKK